MDLEGFPVNIVHWFYVCLTLVLLLSYTGPTGVCYVCVCTYWYLSKGLDKDHKTVAIYKDLVSKFFFLKTSI